MNRTRACLPCFCLLVLLLALGGCGYKLASDQPTVMGNRNVTLKVKGVEHPTLYPWLTYEIRSKLRDEVNARNIARWIDSGHADYEIQINVTAFTSREWMSSADDVGMLYDSNITLDAIIYNGTTNQQVWSSGSLSYSDRTDSSIGRQGQQEIIRQVMRKLADKIQQTF